MTKEIAYMRQRVPFEHVSSLLSLGNALLHLGIIDEPWELEGPEFEEMAGDAGGIVAPVTEEGLERIEERFRIHSRWPRLGVDGYTALEMSKELVVKLIDNGAVVAMPVWVDGVGLHSILITEHTNGQFFTAINRDPFTDNPVKNNYDWETLGYRRWNVPVRVYWRRA